MVVSELIRQAFVLAQIVADGEPLQNNQPIEGLDALNQIIDEWSSVPNFIPTYSLVNITTVIGTYQYNISPVITQLLEANIIDSNNVKSRLTQIFLKEQNLINYQTSAQTRPNEIFVQDDQAAMISGISKVFLNPIPDAVYTVTLYAKQIMSNLVYSDTILTLPPRSIKTFLYQLAKDLNAKYNTILPQSFWDEYETIKNRFKASNKKDMSVHNGNPLLSSRNFLPWGGAYRG